MGEPEIPAGWTIDRVEVVGLDGWFSARLVNLTPDAKWGVLTAFEHSKEAAIAKACDGIRRLPGKE